MKKNEKKSKKISKFWAIAPLALASMGLSTSLYAQIIKTEMRDGKTFLTYKMQPGETASELVKDFKITLKDLSNANPKKDLDKLKYGETIYIPQENPDTENPNELLRGGQKTDESEAAETVLKYVAQANENIYTIAKKHNTTAASLRTLNGMSAGNDKITPGQELVVRISSKKNTKKNIENKGVNTLQIAKNDKGKNQKNLLTNTTQQGKSRGEDTKYSDTKQQFDTLRVESIENKTHVISETETLASIARAHNITQDEILKASNFDMNYRVKTGDKIIIPTKKITLQIVKRDGNETPTVEPIPYIVQQKDNLIAIAEKNHTTVKEIKIWNNIPEDNNLIKEGQKLKIYPPIFESYVVKEGDTWKSIAKKYGITEKQILVWNNIMEDENAIPKQQIDIYKPSVNAKKMDRRTYTESSNTEQEPKNTPKPNAKVKYHHIEYGDNYSKIREQYNISSTEIKFWNNKKLTDDNLSVGDSLKLYLPIEKNHIVKQGETPKQIAQIYGVNIAQIRIWNKLKPKNENYEFDVTEGQKLIIFEPTGPKPSKDFLESRKKMEQKSPINTNKEEKTTPTDVQGLILKKYTVKQEENLYKISKQFGVTPDDIKKWNNLSSSNIKEGDILNIYVAPQQENVLANTKKQNTQEDKGKGNTFIEQPYKKPDGNKQNGKLGDGTLKVETPNPDADPLHQLNESTITNENAIKNVIGEKNNDNDVNKDPENEENSGVQIVTLQGLIQYNQEVRGEERFSVFVREDKKTFASVDITNPKTGTMVTASVAGVITDTLTPSITMEVTPEIMRALGFDLADVPNVKMEFKK